MKLGLFALLLAAAVVLTAAKGKGNGNSNGNGNGNGNLKAALEKCAGQPGNKRQKRFIPGPVNTPPPQADPNGCYGDGGAGCEETTTTPAPTPLEILEEELETCFDESLCTEDVDSGSDGSGEGNARGLKKQLERTLLKEFGIGKIGAQCGINEDSLALIDEALEDVKEAKACGAPSPLLCVAEKFAAYLEAEAENPECVQACECVNNIQGLGALFKSQCEAVINNGNLPSGVLGQLNCNNAKCAAQLGAAAQALDLCNSDIPICHPGQALGLLKKAAEEA